MRTVKQMMTLAPAARSAFQPPASGPYTKEETLTVAGLASAQRVVHSLAADSPAEGTAAVGSPAGEGPEADRTTEEGEHKHCSRKPGRRRCRQEVHSPVLAWEVRKPQRGRTVAQGG